MINISKIVIMAMICNVVLNLPVLSAGMILPCDIASNRNPVMINSRDVMKTTIHALIFSSGNPTNEISAAVISSLSATGSRKTPNFVTMLYFRAMIPSNVSVRLAMIKISSANIRVHTLSMNMNVMKKGTMKIRDMVSLVAKFISYN
jgi:hypothetical protein